jgi:anti-sigma factor RsiW
MTQEIHARAARLIAQDRVESISAAEREWLEQHLAQCVECEKHASATEEAIRSLRGLSVALPRALASRTQLRVQLRAQQLQAYGPRWRMVWAACAVSWLFGAATAPYVWRGLEWIGHRIGLPNIVWQMGFGLWWALPVVVTAVILLMTDAGQSRERAWTGERR